MGGVITQTLIAFALMQVLFGWVVSKYHGMDIFRIAGELIKPKYLVPSLAVSVAFLIINVGLRLMLALFGEG